MGVGIKIDKFTPCLMNRQTGEFVKTTYAPADRRELVGLKKMGWNFNWKHTSLKNSEIYKLTIVGDDTIQGLVAMEPQRGSYAYHLSLAESAPHNIGAEKKYEGVGGHLFAIAAQKSYESGYGGFIYFEAKNPELVAHYQDKFGAIWMRRPHEYSMVIDEEAAQLLLEAYTLEGA